MHKLHEGRAMTQDDRVGTLCAINDIEKVKARYCRFVDTKQWDLLRALFTADCTFDMANCGVADVPDLDAFMAQAVRGLTGCISVHHCHGPEIELTTTSTANAIWAMEDRLHWPDAPAGEVARLHGMGHYHESYVKVDGIWKISAWKLERLRVDVEMA